MKLTTYLLCASLLSLAGACGPANSPTHAGLKNELKSLDSLAYNGTYEQTVAAGEKALQMMDIEDVRESDEMVKDGEDNFTFEAFDESLRIFEMALLKNQRNEKAQAYLAALTPLKHLKGVYWRMTEEGNDETIGYSILRSYDPSMSAFAGQFDRFMYTPYKTKFEHWSDAQNEVFKPFSNDLLKSTEIWASLHGKVELDLYLYLPHLMTTLVPVHIRTADAQVASSISLGIATYTKLYTMYDFASAPFVRTASEQEHHTAQSDWATAMKDPKFGLLTDAAFLNALKGRYLRFSQGVDLAYSALKQREQNKQNDRHDLAQVNRGVVSACTVDHFHTRLDYESFSCAQPHDIEVPYVFTLVDDHARVQLASKVTEASVSFDPSMDDLHHEIELFKSMFFGPVQRTTFCDMHGSGAHEVKYWLDLPTYLLHPVRDLKTSGPLFDDIGGLRGLNDKTVHGLFPQGLPCAY